MSDDISLIIKTFERQSALERLLGSIRAQGYAEHPVLVADDSKTPYKDAILRQYGDVVDKYLELPFNVGVSKGRNELLKHVETEYFVLHDDDFFYGDEIDLHSAKKDLEEHDLDILGGYLFNKLREYYLPWLPKRISNTLGLFKAVWRKQIWMANIEEQSDGGIVVDRLPTNDADIQFCDLSSQFFIARTRSVRDVVGGWNPKLKSIGEHWEFFYRCKQAGLRVATSKNFVAYHENISNPTYDRFRYDRENKMMISSIREHGFKYIQRGDATFYDPTYSARNEQKSLP
jgi:GT2 family glycosyltransferase